MKIVSFTWTTKAFLAGNKTVTWCGLMTNVPSGERTV